MKHGPVKKQPWSERRLEKASKALHKRRCALIAHQQAIANQIQAVYAAAQCVSVGMFSSGGDQPPTPLIH